MNAVKMTMKQFRALTIEEAVKLLGITKTENVYIYFNEDWELDAIVKSDRTGVPADELVALGYVSRYV